MSTATVLSFLSFRPPPAPSSPPPTRSTQDVWHPRPLGFPTRPRSSDDMIPPPVKAHEHVPLDLERSSGSWLPTGIRPTYVQVLLLCAVLLFCLLARVLKSLRLSSRADTSTTLSSCRSTIGDKELCEPQKECQLSEKSAVQSSPASAPERGWWWVDALLGRDADEEAAASAAHSMVTQTHNQLVSHVQNDPELQGYKDTIPFPQLRQQRPPISMAKLIMSRHVRSSHPI